MFNVGDKVKCVDATEGEFNHLFDEQVVLNHIYLVDEVRSIGSLSGLVIRGIVTPKTDKGLDILWDSRGFVKVGL